MTTPAVPATNLETIRQQLEQQLKPIDEQLTAAKQTVAHLEAQKRKLAAVIKSLDPNAVTIRKPMSAEARAKLSQSIKAAFERKKQGLAAAGVSQAAPEPKAPTPVVDTKMRAANDDSTSAPPKRKKGGR